MRGAFPVHGKHCLNVGQNNLFFLLVTPHQVYFFSFLPADTKINTPT